MDIPDKLAARYGLGDSESQAEIRAMAVGQLFVSHLAKIRMRAGLTQNDVAARMATDQATVAKLETHRHDPRLSTLLRYISALGEEGNRAIELFEAFIDETDLARWPES
jgi:transcriptional regulator with XRE-family HTH domain